MLFLALGLLSLAALIGFAIGIRFLGDGRLPSRPIGTVHGLLATSGLSVLIVALLGGTGTGDRYGTSFGPAAAILATLAALAGGGIALLARRIARGIGFLIGVHASLAVAAYVLLLAYALLT